MGFSIRTLINEWGTEALKQLLIGYEEDCT